jgi:hypothetical protein
MTMFFHPEVTRLNFLNNSGAPIVTHNPASAARKYVMLYPVRPGDFVAALNATQRTARTIIPTK